MKKSTNTNWFTLVELIIVITILAILATIAFISFQSYTKDARDASKKSEIANIVKVIAADEAKNGRDLLTYIKGTPGEVTGLDVQGNSTATSATGKLNTEMLGLNNSKYADDYEIAVYTGSLNVYQVRAAMENAAENGAYFVSGTYSPRSSTLTGSITDDDDGNKYVLTDGIGIAKIGDILDNSADDADYTVIAISSDLKTITLSWAVTTTENYSYTYNEDKSLFE